MSNCHIRRLTVLNTEKEIDSRNAKNSNNNSGKEVQRSQKEGFGLAKYIEINGMDEAGAIGQHIFFARVGVGVNNEVQLFLRNLSHFGTLMPSKFKLSGYDDNYLLKYLTSLIDDSTYKIDLYKMSCETQLKLLAFLSVQTVTDLQQQRKELVAILDPSSGITKEASDAAVQRMTDTLKRFKNPRIWAESFIKSYGMMQITKELGTSAKARKQKLSNEGFSDFFCVSQVAGGYPFAFWWKTLMNKGHFSKGEYVVTGVCNGDYHYPCMSAAGTIATSLMRNMERLHTFPIKTIDFDESADFLEFYKGHCTALELPIFQKRLLFLGKMNENLKMCLPYLDHLRDIRYTPEATNIEVPIEWFFQARGYRIEDTIIIHSNMLSQRDKENIKFCKTKGYKLNHVCEYKKDFEALITKIETETEYAPMQKRIKLAGTLKEIKDACLKEMG